MAMKTLKSVGSRTPQNINIELDTLPENESDALCRTITVHKYVDLASDAVTKAVQTTFQTYVDTLKAQGKFDKEAQLTALQKAKDTATALITDEAKRVIAEAYGDFDKWLASTIETLVREDKRTAPAATEEKQTQIATTAATAAASVAATVAQTAVAQATAEVKAAKATETATE